MMSDDSLNKETSLDDLFRDVIVKPKTIHLESPFKFLDPYAPEDRAVFFGREDEIADLYRKFFKEPLVVVYGPSGAGKSSLIQCGLRGEIPSEDAFFISVRIARDPLNALHDELQRQVLFDGEPPQDIAEALNLTARIKSKTIVLVFDQFEELFLFQPKPVRDKFVAAIADWLNRIDNIRIIIGIREEFLAQLTELEHFLPGIFQNRLRVRRMGREQARDAIILPCRAWGGEIDPQLVEELLSELDDGDREVELPILQVVLDTLSRRAYERDPKHPSINSDDYQSLGRLNAILARFVEDKVATYNDPSRVRQILKAMITVEGTRQLSTLTEIRTRAAQFGDPVDETELQNIVRQLIGHRILQEEPDGQLFELRHDSLALTVLQWMSGMEQELAAIRQMLENRHKEYLSFGDLLDDKVLHHIEPYQSRLQLSNDLDALVQRSRKALQSRKNRNAKLRAGTLAFVFAIVAGLGLYSYIKYQEAEHNLAAALFEKAQRFFDEGRYNEAAISVAEAWVLAPEQYYPGLVQDEGLLMKLNGFMSASDAYVSDAVFSLDGKRLYTAHYDNIVREWELESMHLLGEPVHHNAGVKRIILTNEGQLLVSADFSGLLKFTRISTGQLEHELTGHKADIYALGLSPDGKLIVSGDAIGAIRLWDAESSKAQPAEFLFIDSEVMAAGFSHDGRHLITASASNGPLTLWDLCSRQRFDLIKEQRASIWDFKLAFDSGALLTADRAGEIIIWDINTKKRLAQHSEPDSEFLTIAELPDAHLLLTGERQGRMKSWAWQAEKTVAKQSNVLAHRMAIRKITWSSIAGQIATVSTGGEIKLWFPQKEVNFRPFRGHDSGITDMVLSSDGRFLVTSDNLGTLKKWDTDTGLLIDEHVISDQPNIAKLAFRPNTDEIALIHGATFAILKSDNWQEIYTYKLNNKTTIQASIVFTSDGKKVLLPFKVKHFNLLDLATKEIEQSFEGHPNDIFTLAISDNDQIVASGSGDSDKVIKLWRLNDGALIKPELHHVQGLNDIDIKDHLLVSGTERGYIYFWDLNTHKLIHKFEGFTEKINTLQLSPDGNLLAAGNNTGIIKLWQVDNAKLLSTMHGHGGGITSLKFSPDSKILYSAGKGGKMRKWEIARILSGSSADYLKHIRKLTGLKADGISVVPLTKEEWLALPKVK